MWRPSNLFVMYGGMYRIVDVPTFPIFSFESIVLHLCSHKYKFHVKWCTKQKHFGKNSFHLIFDCIWVFAINRLCAKCLYAEHDWKRKRNSVCIKALDNGKHMWLVQRKVFHRWLLKEKIVVKLGFKQDRMYVPLHWQVMGYHSPNFIRRFLGDLGIYLHSMNKMR